MKTHADSQIDTAELTRLTLAALTTPDYRAQHRLVQACAISTQEVLARWTWQSPEGEVHRVALVRMLDGEPMGFDNSYTDKDDAISVWTHIYEGAVADGTAKAPQVASDSA
ncbi:hypothetical protein EXE59_09895 [Nocardioides eburneiflavus]|uniref:Uncharacterized protein n=1 Tax=Nocardioides eburneiflavus TaxID=2518372 RepID=A0A4Z1BSF3_9ACTN|nr:hypothetical protein [Nocardioides eburneiflavus]TGN64231.1 hypothetical protein EXE59_09895 [Nocardioides eburneiflavus]